MVVYPGSYVEHVNFRGKNVILGSLFLQTNDSSFIDATIIDGTINVISNEDTTAQLVGFSVTNNEDENVFGVNAIGSGITLKHNKIYGHNYGAISIDNSNLVIEDCYIFDNIKPSGNGGAILANNESFIDIKSTSLFNNFINSGNDNGGGISIQGSSIGQISDSKIHGNVAGNWGGGIYVWNESSLQISNSEIFGNSSIYSGGGNGGGIAVDSQSEIILNNVDIYDNDAIMGGGIFVRSSSIDYQRGTIFNNTGESYGGGVGINGGNDVSFKNVIIDSNSLTGSSNKFGGGFYINNANSIIFEQCVISRNDASDGNGGGFYLGGTISPVFTNCTVADNIANSGGGFYREGNPTPFMKNTIVFFNDGSSFYSPSGFTTEYCNIEGGHQWGSNILNENPLFVDSDNGNYHLLSNSPCVDSGDPDTDNDGSIYTVDVDDQDPDSTRKDIGAYFYDQSDTIPPVIIVNSLNDQFGTEGQFNISWEASDNIALDDALIYLFNDELLVDVLINSVDAQIVDDILVSVPDSLVGNNFQIVVEVNDIWSNSARDTSNYFRLFDDTNPQLEILEPIASFSVPENILFEARVQQTDNIELKNNIVEYSKDGLSFDTLVITDIVENSFPLTLNGVTENGVLKITAIDTAGNFVSVLSEPITVTDNTAPIVELITPSITDTFKIANSTQITWSSSDNVGLAYFSLEYKYDEIQGWMIINDQLSAEDSVYNWIVPNTPTREASVRLIGFDQVGLSDTALVTGFSIEESYPIVLSYSPNGQIVNWNQNNIEIKMSQAMDSTSIDNDAIEFNSNYSSDIEYLTYYNSDSNSINIEFYPSLATLDSIEIVLKSQEITNIYGYNLDGNNDGVGEGDYTIQFSTSMLADFNEDNEISLEDLSAFVIALDNDDFNYELGPFDGQIPNVSVEKDEKFDIEDIVGFAMMWNWYFSNVGTSFQTLEDEGVVSTIEVSHDTIHISIPHGISAYQLQLQYEPGNLVINSLPSEKRGELFLSNQSSIDGIYTIMATPNTNHLAIPIQIIGKNAQVYISYKGIDKNGLLHGKMTRSKNIENIPENFALYDNYPNPFNPQTRIDFGLPEEGLVELKIYDVMGREIITLVNDVLQPGYKSVQWNATNKTGQPVSAGMYFYALRVKDFTQIKKMVLLK